MSNVYFKRGLQKDLPTSNIIDGAFYLTQDTHRLYVGQASSSGANAEVKLQLLNQNIHIVDSINNLEIWTGADAQAHKSDVYYCTAQNVLAIWTIDPDNASAYKWVQINPDTDTFLGQLDVVAAQVSGENQATFKIQGHKYKNNTDTNQTVISDAMTFAGADGITVTANATNKTITFTGDDYTFVNDVTGNTNDSLANNTATIGLKNKSATNNIPNKGAVTFKGGDNITLKNGGTDTITIVAKDTKSTDQSTLTSNNGTLTFTNKFNDNTQVVTTATNVGIKAIGSSSDSTPIVVPLNSSVTEVSSSNKDSLIYTAAAIDAKINSINGMTYKGTAGNVTGATVQSLPTTGVHAGDTYTIIDNTSTFFESIVAANKGDNFNTVNGHFVVGDLVIASGTETNGVITSNLKWNYIPSGNDSLADVTYSAVVDTANKNLVLRNANTANYEVAKVAAVNGDEINATATSIDSGKGIQFKFDHATHTATNTTDTTAATKNGDNYELTSISGITVNGYGHVTGYTTTTYQVPIHKINIAAATINAGYTEATIPVELKSNNLIQSSGNIKLKTETLYLNTSTSGGNNYVDIDLKWGTF